MPVLFLLSIETFDNRSVGTVGTDSRSIAGCIRNVEFYALISRGAFREQQVIGQELVAHAETDALRVLESNRVSVKY